MKKSQKEKKSRILTLTKTRGLTGTDPVSPSEVTRDLFSDVWKENVDEVRTTVGELQSEKLVSVTRRDNDIRLDEAKGKGPIRFLDDRQKK